ncbi:MAG: YciI family protein [Muribaculaceae bacterium]|nr:YciI family protein [Muribaculaceae bacterium]
MFIAVLTYTKPLECVDKYLAEHRAFLAEEYAKGTLLMSGPRKNRVGGVIMIKTGILEEAEEILSRDPFRIHFIADYNIVEFTPTLFCSDVLSELL